MAIKKTDKGYQVDIQPGGRGGKRVRKTFEFKAEALAWERHVQAKVQSTPEWLPPKKDLRLLSALVDVWFQQHGSGLRDGENTKKRLLRVCAALDEPRADGFTAEMFAKYRAKRIEAGITPNNMNRDHAYLRAMFNELVRLGVWKKDNPLKQLRAFKVQERELSYLTIQQIETLLKCLTEGRNAHAHLIARVCLATGARWGEAEGMLRSQVKQGHIQFVQTKSAKTRAVPISKKLQKELEVHHEKHGEGERMFASAFSAFRSAVDRAELTLPKGQLTHILRHTFASHFMMDGGNILSLQRALGHQSLTMTMRYAHLSPEHLQEVVRLNPLAKLLKR